MEGPSHFSFTGKNNYKLQYHMLNLTRNYRNARSKTNIVIFSMPMRLEGKIIFSAENQLNGDLMILMVTR